MMSRSGYSDDYDQWTAIRWRGQVTSAIRGKRGQRLLRDLITAMDALPIKRLIAEELIDEAGEVCAIGAVGKLRGVDMTNLDPEDQDSVGNAFDVATALAAEIAYVNDEGAYAAETPEQRFTRVRAWAEQQLIEWEKP